MKPVIPGTMLTWAGPAQHIGLCQDSSRHARHYYTKDLLRRRPNNTPLLTEAVAKSNCLVKYMAINGGGCFIYRDIKNDHLAKSIYADGCFIYVGGQETTASVNRFTEADLLRRPPLPRIIMAEPTSNEKSPNRPDIML
jgi:hypothetical protein